MHAIRFLPALTAILLVVPALASNQVFVVAPTLGPGVFTTFVPLAILAAGDGDVILIKAGTYAGTGASVGFSIENKSLTLMADNGAAVTLNGTFQISYLAAGKQVCLRGIDIVGSGNSFTTGAALELSNVEGSVWVEDCDLTGALPGGFSTVQGGNGLRASNCSSAILTRCSMTGAPGSSVVAPGYDGAYSASSSVCMYDCTVTGGHGASMGGPFGNTSMGGVGARLVGGFLFASGSSFIGGQGGNGLAGTPCVSGAQGGLALHLSTASPQAATLACTITGGAGGAAPVPPGSCQAGATGQAVQIDTGAHTLLPGPAHHMLATATPREGQTLTKSYTGSVGEFVFVGFGVNHGFVYIPAFLGVLVLSSPFVPVFEGVVPAGGTLTKLTTIGELGAGVGGVTLYLQSAFYDTLTGVFQAAPSVTVLLDSSL